MSNNYFLTNVNSIIGENARYARQLQSNPQSTSNKDSATTTNNASTDPNAMASMLNPLILLMMFQMMMQMMGGNTQNTSQLMSQLLGGALDPGLIPGLNNNAAPLQNPAYQFINNQLLSSATPTSNTVDFTDNASIQQRIDSILAPSTNPSMQYYASLLKTTDPSAPEMPQIQANLDSLLQQEGRDTQEFDLLAQALQINPVLQQLQATASSDPSIAQQYSLLQQAHTAIASQWTQTYGNTDAPATNAASLVSSVQNAMKQGQFTEAQLGQSLKYMLDKAPDTIANQAALLLANLMESGDLNVSPFLANDYLAQLSPDRQSLVLSAVETSGLTLSNGKPNSRFIGFMLDQLNRTDSPTTKLFVQQFLQDFYDEYGSKPDTPVGGTLANLLTLAGIQADTTGQLQFT